MKKHKIRMIIAIIVTAILLMYAIMPVFSLAENEELNMKLTRVEIDGGVQINVEANSPSKILALSYISGKKEISDFEHNVEALIAYFEGENAQSLTITSENYIDTTFNVTQYGTYTIYIRNADGEIQLNTITIRDKAAITLEVSEQNVNNVRNIVIKASSTSNIVAIKILKTDDATTPANFTDVPNLLSEENTNVELISEITEIGIYQIYVQDANGNKKIQTINIFEGESPITINSTVNGNSVTINVTDTIADIQLLKIAKQSEINEISDFENVGTVIAFIGTNNITATYEVQEQGNYVIYAKDNAGNSLMQSVTICKEPTQTMQFYRLSSDLSKIYVIVNNDTNNINFAKYMISTERKTIQEVKDNGTELSVTEGKEVVLEIVEPNLEDSNFVNVYVSDTLGFGKLTGITVNGIQIVDNLPGEEVNNDQPTQNPDENETPEQNPTTPEGEVNPDDFPTIPDVEDTPVEDFPTIPDVDETPEQTPTIPEEDNAPEQTPTTPEEDNTPDQTPTTPEEDNAPDQTPTTPEEDNAPEQTPTTPEEDNTPEQTPTIPEEDNAPEQNQTGQPENGTNNDGPIDITDIEGDEFEEIQDKDDNTTTGSETITVYPQTGDNNYIVYIGIAISSTIAVVSYRKMKLEE